MILESDSKKQELQKIAAIEIYDITADITKFLYNIDLKIQWIPREESEVAADFIYLKFP